jgi:RNA polymerase sigma-70 factor (ECF subfamily)
MVLAARYLNDECCEMITVLHNPDSGTGTRPHAAVIQRAYRNVSLGKQSFNFAREPRMAETSILERISDGDKSAVQDCLDAYGALIWSLARRFLGNESDAEDAVQDIYIAIWSAAGQFDASIASEITFISTIARRRLIDRIRKSGRRPITESLDNEASAPPQPAVASGLEESAEIAKVERALGTMRPENREILSMSLYEGYSHSEIASHMEIPLGTVKTRVRRGLMQIREQLQVTDNITKDDRG